MVSLNLSLLESELGAFRRQKRLQYVKSFPVGWQPLVKGASLAEGAHMTVLGESGSDIEWQRKVLEYQRAPFWQRWYLRLFTSQVAQLELYFYARFALFLTLLKQTSSPSLYRVRRQHLQYYLDVAEHTLPWFSPLVRAVKRASAVVSQRVQVQSSSLLHSTYSQDSSSPTASEKLSLDGEYHYTYLRNQLQPRRKRVFSSQRGIQPVPIRPPSPESPGIPDNIVHHYQHMKRAFQTAILSETDVFRRQAWISRQSHVIRSLRQHADAIGLRLPIRLPSQASTLQWPSVAPSFSFSQRLSALLPACRQRLLTLYQGIREYSWTSKPAVPSPSLGQLGSEPESKHFHPPAGKAQESGQKLRRLSAEQTHSLSREFDQVFRQFLNRLIASPKPNFNIINTLNQQRVHAMQRIQDKFSSLDKQYETSSAPVSKAKRLDLYHELQQLKQRFRKLAKQYPSLTPFTTQHLEGWLYIHQQRLAEIKDYQTQYVQWLEIKRPQGITAFATFHATPPQSLQEELWQSLGHFYRDLLTACQAYVIKRRRVKKPAPDESTFLLLQKGFHTLRQLTREWFKEIPATKAAPFNKQVVQWEAAILNSLPRLMQIKTDSKEINEFKKISTPPSAPTIKLPEDAYMEFHQSPFRQYLEYYFVCGLFAINIEEKDHKLIHTQLADGVEALSSALQRSRTLSSSSDETGKTLTHLAEYAAHAEFQLRHPQPPLDVPDQQKIRWQCATEYMQTHGHALRQQWLAAPSLSKNHSESHSEDPSSLETQPLSNGPSGLDFPDVRFFTSPSSASASASSQTSSVAPNSNMSSSSSMTLSTETASSNSFIGKLG
jgi:hypothetical protein